MKKIIVGLVLSLVVLVPLTNLKAASPCDGKITFIIADPKDINTIKDVFANYDKNDYLVSEYGIDTLLSDNINYLCFKSESTGSIVLSEPLLFHVKNSYPVYISGLRLKANGAEPLLTIVNSSDIPETTVTLADSEFTNVKTGLVIEGIGKVEVKNTTITGASKEGSCIDVSALNAVFDAVTVSNCKEGISVKANDFQIANSTLSNIQTGLMLGGAGKVEVKNTVITGDALNKTGSCIDVASPSAFFDTVTAKDCGTGAMVKADNVQFKNSTISKNGIGINVGNGIKGMQVRGTVISSNKPADANEGTEDRLFGIKTNDGLLTRDLSFVIESNNQIVSSPLVDGAHKYIAGQNVFIVVPDDKISNEGTVELFETSPDCKFQACVATNVFSKFDPQLTKDNGLSYRLNIPSSLKNKKIVAMYTDPISGSSEISQPFTTADSLIVAFVTSGYDMPTSSGMTGGSASGMDAGDDKVETVQQGTGGANQMGGDGAGVISGGGMLDAVTGSKTGACSLSPNIDQSMQFSGFLWWIIFLSPAIGVLGFARIKRK